MTRSTAQFNEVLLMPRKTAWFAAVMLWAWAIGFLIFMMVNEHPVEAMVFVGTGWGTLGFLALRMGTRVVVKNDSLHLRLKGTWWFKKAPLHSIVSAEVIDLPETERTNRGYHIVGRKRRNLHMGEPKAVEITLRNGYTYRVGTQRPEELLTAIRGGG